MTNLNVVLSVFAEFFNELSNDKKRTDGLGIMPTYYAEDAQDYQEHYIKLDHNDYIANISFTFNQEMDSINVRCTTDDEDNGDQSGHEFTLEEYKYVAEKRDLLIAMYQAKFDALNEALSFNFIE